MVRANTRGKTAIVAMAISPACSKIQRDGSMANLVRSKPSMPWPAVLPLIILKILSDKVADVSQGSLAGRVFIIRIDGKAIFF